MIRRGVMKLTNAISVVVILFALILLLAAVFTERGDVPKVGGFSMLRVITGSMEPEIMTDALVIIHEIPAEELKVGDVISFYSNDPELDAMINTHRITRIEIGEDGNLLFYTKGDANNAEDLYPTAAKDIVGQVVYTSLILGKAVRLLSNPLIFLPFIMLPLAGLLLYNLITTIRYANKMSRLDEEQAFEEAVERLRKKQQEIKAEKEEQEE